MAAVTGLIALLGVFLAGPYRTLQVRLPTVWGRRISTWAHANVSIFATAAVLVHAGLELGISVTWVATWLFLVSFVSGLYGMYMATGPGSRRAWLRRHRVLTVLFYGAIAFHVVGSLLGWAVLVAAPGALAVWQWRDRMREVLAGLLWPMRKSIPVR